MTDKLVKRLREIGEGDMYLAPTSTKAIIDIAADRIEKLEAALRKIAKHDMQSIALNALIQKISDPFADTTEKKDE